MIVNGIGTIFTKARPTGSAAIYWPTNEQGNPNLQLKADVKVFDENGTDISATAIQWSR